MRHPDHTQTAAVAYNCATCGKQFWRAKPDDNAKYCSRSCIRFPQGVRLVHGHCRRDEDGVRFSETYRAWRDMKNRCFRPQTDRYPRYGARGITVCRRWMTFANFLADMGPKPLGPTKFYLDRIDNDGNYEPGNCRWVDGRTSASNTSHSRHLTYDGRTMTLTQWARELNKGVSTILFRLKSGWDVQDALMRPVRPIRR